jgi:hypothetical protein
MFQPIRTDPPPDQVRWITFVPFLADGFHPFRPPAPTAWITAP